MTGDPAGCRPGREVPAEQPEDAAPVIDPECATCHGSGKGCGPCSVAVTPHQVANIARLGTGSSR